MRKIHLKKIINKKNVKCQKYCDSCRVYRVRAAKNNDNLSIKMFERKGVGSEMQ